MWIKSLYDDTWVSIKHVTHFRVQTERVVRQRVVRQKNLRTLAPVDDFFIQETRVCIACRGSRGLLLRKRQTEFLKLTMARHLKICLQSRVLPCELCLSKPRGYHVARGFVGHS